MKHSDFKLQKEGKTKSTKDNNGKQINNNKPPEAQPVSKIGEDSSLTNSQADDLLKRVQRRSLAKKGEGNLGPTHFKKKSINTTDKILNATDQAENKAISNEKYEIHIENDGGQISQNTKMINTTQKVPCVAVETKESKIINNSQSNVTIINKIPTNPNDSLTSGVPTIEVIPKANEESTGPDIVTVENKELTDSVILKVNEETTAANKAKVIEKSTISDIKNIEHKGPTVSEIRKDNEESTVSNIPKGKEESTFSDIAKIHEVPTIPTNIKVTGESGVGSIPQVLGAATKEENMQVPGISTVTSIPQVPEATTVQGIPKINGIPIVPGIPKVPSVPGIPKVPGIPPVPGIPQVPSVPGIPKVPGIPPVPGIPKVPGIPPVPGIPQVPSVPGIPKVPGIPPVPGIPKVPGIPPVPGIPQVPSVPGIPKVPGIPTVPPVPGIPKTPGIPTIPGIPKAPGVPTIPGIPKAPGVPGIPQAPGIPGTGPSIPLGIPNIQSNAPKVKQKVKTNNPMKPLYWNVIESRKIKGTVWETLDDNKISINITKFEEEFGVKKKEVIVVDQKEKEKKPVNTKISLLLPARQQNITIVLSKLRLPVIEVVEAMIKYDESILYPSRCELLLPILPSAPETALFEQYEDDAMNLMDCDLFIWLLLTAEGAAARLKSIIFKSMYEEEVNNISKNINTIYLAFDFISGNKAFHRWLELILAHGNYLNGSSSRGGAYAFKVDILSKLTELKSTDNKKTFLFYLVEYVAEVLKDEEMLNITPFLQVFGKMCLQEITDSYKELSVKFKDITSFYTKVQKGELNFEEDDQSVPFFASFYEKAAKSMSMLDEKFKGIDERYNTLVKFLGDTSSALSLETVTEIFKQFNKDLETTKANYARTKELKEKAEKKKK